MNTVIYSQPGLFKKVIFSRQVGSRDGLGNLAGPDCKHGNVSGRQCSVCKSSFRKKMQACSQPIFHFYHHLSRCYQTTEAFCIKYKSCEGLHLGYQCIGAAATCWVISLISSGLQNMIPIVSGRKLLSLAVRRLWCGWQRHRDEPCGI